MSVLNSKNTIWSNASHFESHGAKVYSEQKFVNNFELTPEYNCTKSRFGKCEQTQLQQLKLIEA